MSIGCPSFGCQKCQEPLSPSRFFRKIHPNLLLSRPGLSLHSSFAKMAATPVTMFISSLRVARCDRPFSTQLEGLLSCATVGAHAPVNTAHTLHLSMKLYRPQDCTANALVSQ